MALVGSQGALFAKKRIGFGAAGSTQRQGYRYGINARAYAVGAGFGPLLFLSHPGPHSLIFLPLRQTGTPLATWIRIRTEWGVFQGSR